MKEIRNVVYSSDLEGNGFIEKQKDNGVECVPVLDARSAVYYATGISAQNKETVLVCVKANNASRSAFSGMTEAYYRKLPVVLITFGDSLDYSNELGDVVYSHFSVESSDDVEQLISNPKPMHIEIKEECAQTDKISVDFLQPFISSLKTENYLYLSNGVSTDVKASCKVVHGGMPGCFEGALANVLGASLVKIRERYIGIVTEEEFLHDMNTLGNINVNDRLFYIVICNHENEMILDYAKALNFEVSIGKCDDFTEEKWDSLLENNRKTVAEIYRN